MAKIEGTSQTYGQLVYINSQRSANPTTEQTSAATQENVKANTPSEGSFDQLTSVTAQITPNDKLVKIIEDSSSTITSAQTAIALAAASSNPGATAVVAPGTLSVNTNSPGVLQTVPAVVGQATVVGSAVKTDDEVNKALEEAYKLDWQTSLHSKESESLQFNNLKVPKLKAKFVYNFFESEESDIAIQEDQARDPLLKAGPTKVPKYVDLQWNMIGTTEPVAGTVAIAKENQELRQSAFAKKRGSFSETSSNFAHSITKQEKQTTPFLEDGIKRSVVDLHEPEIAFGAIANSTAFSNAVSVTVNTENQTKVLSEIPVDYKGVKKTQ